MKNNIQTTIFLQTKLHRPPVGRDYLYRRRLLETLNRGLHRPVTLVSAPAGYGKSTLISNWLDMSDHASAWLSLDEQDNNLRQFMIGFQEAVGTIFPEAGRNIQAILEADNLPPLDVIVCEVNNDLDRLRHSFVLVLDDFHVIQDALVQMFVRELLRHPPKPLHLVLISRKDPFLPMSALRARDQLTEVRTKDLRFTELEVREFLKISLEDRFEDTLAVELAKKTEGWVTGIRLALLAAQGQDDSLVAVSKLEGTASYVADYLVTEVLNAQSPTIRHLLLATSILSRFCADLCNQLGARDSELPETRVDGKDFIVRLQTENLFLIALDDNDLWFRYHHLLQKLLRDQLNRRCSPKEIAELHKRASRWFEEEGLVEEAFQHALATGDMELAALLVERHADIILNDVKVFVLERWIAQLPRDLVQKRPKLLWAEAWRHFFRLDIDALPELMDRIEDLMGGHSETHTLSKDILMFRSLCALTKNESARALQLSEQVLHKPGFTSHPVSRGLAEQIFALSGLMEGHKERVTQSLTSWLADPSKRDPYNDIQRLHALTTVSYIAAEPSGIGDFLRRGREIARSHNIEYLLAWNEYFDGIFHLQKGDLDTALRLLKEAERLKYFNNIRAAADGMCALVLVYQAQGKHELAFATLQNLDRLIWNTKSTFRHLSESCALRLALMQDKSESAARWLESTVPPADEIMFFWFEIPCVTWCRALIAEGSNVSLRQARKRLQEYAAMNEAHHNTLHQIEVLSLLALVNEKLARHEESLNILQQALTLARPSGFIFPFLEIGAPMVGLLNRLPEKKVGSDLIKRVLSTCATEITPSSVPTHQPLVDPLSNRELEVLDLLKQKLQTKEIADKLCISPNTVRTHLQNIYQKLCVGNRRQAVARAIDLGILANR